MTVAHLERLHENLQRLRLFKGRERLEALLHEAAEKQMSYADFLDGVLCEEVASKTAKNVTMRTSLARFPFVKGLESFDFAYQPSLDKKQIQHCRTATSSSTARISSFSGHPAHHPPRMPRQKSSQCGLLRQRRMSQGARKGSLGDGSVGGAEQLAGTSGRSVTAGAWRARFGPDTRPLVPRLDAPGLRDHRRCGRLRRLSL